MSETPTWGTDTPISLPMPPETPDAAKVEFGGLAFTPMGLIFDLTEADREAMISAPYGPQVNP